MPIHVLPEIVAAQIAAGEVVERPASVVKELIENALDADATSITVEVENGGRGLLRVSDNGSGIAATEAELAFARHSTSKLQSVSDLDSIRTLGFRGEALASIAAVSRTTMTTRHRDEQAGTTVMVEGGEVMSVQPAGAPAGTVLAVENLFFNTPARLKFMKSESAERRQISQLVTRYAMAYPGVRFRLAQEGREQFRSTGSGDLADVIVEAFGLDSFRDMVEVSPQPPPRPDVPPIDVYGFTSTPDLVRSRRDQIILFVNGRSVVDQRLTYAVIQAYRDLLPQGKHPITVLLITLPPEDVDVNVHPTKAEVRFRVPDAVFAAVQRAVRMALSGIDTPSGYGGSYTIDSSGWHTREPGRAEEFSTPDWGGPARRAARGGDEQLSMGLDVADQGRFTGDERSDEADVAIPAGAGTPLRPRTLPILRVVGQVGATYVVAEGPAGLYLLDQHAAHERVLYEMLTRRHASGEPVESYELEAVTIDLPPALANTLESILDTLNTLGFDVALFGTSTFRVRAVPRVLSNAEPGEALHFIAANLDMDDSEAALIDSLLERIAGLGAYKAGQTLTFEQMGELVRQLERCEQPRVDLEGGPTLIQFSGEDLARQFGRQ